MASSKISVSETASPKIKQCVTGKIHTRPWFQSLSSEGSLIGAGEMARQLGAVVASSMLARAIECSSSRSALAT